jgi:hypothetical protein
MSDSAPVVFYAETSAVDYQRLLSEWADDLEQDEWAALHRLRLERDRRNYLAAHAVLRLALRALPGRRTSLTHTRDFVACAVAPDDQQGIGVDAEPLAAGARLLSIGDEFLAPSEQARLSTDPEVHQRQLVEAWTVKEAALKQRGIGLADVGGARGLILFETSVIGRVDEWTTIAVRDARTGDRVVAHVRGLNEYVLSVVSDSSAVPRLVEQRL